MERDRVISNYRKLKEAKKEREERLGGSHSASSGQTKDDFD